MMVVMMMMAVVIMRTGNGQPVICDTNTPPTFFAHSNTVNNGPNGPVTYQEAVRKTYREICTEVWGTVDTSKIDGCITKGVEVCGSEDTRLLLENCYSNSDGDYDGFGGACYDWVGSCFQHDPSRLGFHKSPDIILWSGAQNEALAFSKITHERDEPTTPLVLDNTVVANVIGKYFRTRNYNDPNCDLEPANVAASIGCHNPCGFGKVSTLRVWIAMSRRLAERACHSRVRGSIVYVLLKSFRETNVFSTIEFPTMIRVMYEQSIRTIRQRFHRHVVQNHLPLSHDQQNLTPKPNTLELTRRAIPNQSKAIQRVEVYISIDAARCVPRSSTVPFDKDALRTCMSRVQKDGKCPVDSNNVRSPCIRDAECCIRDAECTNGMCEHDKSMDFQALCEANNQCVYQNQKDKHTTCMEVIDFLQKKRYETLLTSIIGKITSATTSKLNLNDLANHLCRYEDEIQASHTSCVNQVNGLFSASDYDADRNLDVKKLLLNTDHPLEKRLRSLAPFSQGMLCYEGCDDTFEKNTGCLLQTFKVSKIRNYLSRLISAKQREYMNPLSSSIPTSFLRNRKTIGAACELDKDCVKGCCAERACHEPQNIQNGNICNAHCVCESATCDFHSKTCVVASQLEKVLGEICTSSAECSSLCCLPETEVVDGRLICASQEKCIF